MPVESTATRWLPYAEEETATELLGIQFMPEPMEVEISNADPSSTKARGGRMAATDRRHPASMFGSITQYRRMKSVRSSRYVFIASANISTDLIFKISGAGGQDPR